MKALNSKHKAAQQVTPYQEQPLAYVALLFPIFSDSGISQHKLTSRYFGGNITQKLNNLPYQCDING